MAEEGGDHVSRSGVKWGIYERLKKVPPFSSPKSARVTSTRTRKMDLTEKAAETAARRMVEDHFKEDSDSADPMADFALIDSNEILHRGRKQQEGTDPALCECVALKGDSDKPAQCPLGDKCKNPKFERYQDSKTKLVKTDNKGWGLVADEDLKAGDFVVEYCGEVVPSKEGVFRAKVYEASGLKDSYTISLNATEFIDATRKGSFGRFVNHSCEPNCEMKKLTGLGEDRIGIYTTVDIPAGTELTIDYLKSRWYSGDSKVRCACGAKSCIGTLGGNSKSLHADAYAWEDDVVKAQVEDAQLSADEDDAPLSSFIKGIVPKKLKGVPSTKGRGIVENNAGLEKAAIAPARESLQGGKDAQPSGSGESPVVKTAENSTMVRRSRSATIKKGDDSPKIATVVAKFKETPPDARLRKGVTKLPVKPNALEEEEIKVARKRANAEAQGGEGRAATSVEQMLSDNLSRVEAFKRARTLVNKLLEDETSSCFPVSEAACAEVEFAQELEMAAVSDYKTTCEIVHPAMKEFQKAGEEVSFAVAQKWMEAHYKMLGSSLDFHFSIIRHLAGPTFALSLSEESTP
ncbi:unnamed protein product [Calypogeia fissa]